MVELVLTRGVIILPGHADLVLVWRDPGGVAAAAHLEGAVRFDGSGLGIDRRRHVLLHEKQPEPADHRFDRHRFAMEGEPPLDDVFGRAPTTAAANEERDDRNPTDER